MRFASRWLGKLRRRANRLNKDQRGLEGLEYLLIAALVIIAAVAAWRFLGERIDANVRKVGAKVDTATEESSKKGLP